MQFKSHVFLLLILVTVLNQNTCSQTNTKEAFDTQLSKAQSFKNIDTDSLIHYVNKAQIIAESNNNYNQKIDVLFMLIKYKVKSSDLLGALALSDSVSLIVEKHNLNIRLTENLIYIGNIYQLMGFNSKALEIFIEAQKLLEQSESHFKEADLYYYLALLYYNINEINNCHKYLRLSLNLLSNKKTPGDIFSVHMLYANSFNNIDSIQLHLFKAESLIVQNPKLVFEKVALLNNLAIYNKALQDFKLSKEQYIEAINISKNNGFQEYLSNTYNNYAYLLMAESNYDSANIVLAEALKIAKELNSVDLQASIYDSYADYFVAVNDYKNAHSYQDSSITARNIYRQQQQIQKSLFLSAVFDTEQKEKEILKQENKITRMGIYLLGVFAVLVLFIAFTVYFRQRNELTKSRMVTIQKEKFIEITDAVIVAQDTERKRLAMDLHDILGVPFASLRFLIDDILISNNRYDEVINSIINIHDNIRSISHRMQPPELEMYGLAPAIQSLIAPINKTGSFKIDFEYDIESEVSSKFTKNTYFLVHELINNAIKHSNGNSIFVQLLEHENEISLSVEDNGTGFHYDKSMAGMGMKNIQTRVDYLKGSINIESTGNDTSVIIEIPLV